MKQREPISIVWLKRDLRLSDNDAIYNALQLQKRTLLIYAFEPILINDKHYSERHWILLKNSL